MEYEKLHRALKKSHESEKRLIKKCQELNGEIVAAQAAGGLGGGGCKRFFVFVDFAKTCAFFVFFFPQRILDFCGGVFFDFENCHILPCEQTPYKGCWRS